MANLPLQRCGEPVVQKKHCPQERKRETTTRSSGLAPVTPTPTSSTIPAASPRYKWHGTPPITADRVYITVADARGSQPDLDFAGLRWVNVDRFNNQRLTKFVADGGFHYVHFCPPSKTGWMDWQLNSAPTICARANSSGCSVRSKSNSGERG